MASKSVNTGDAGALVVTISVAGGSDSGNYSDVDWALYLNERVSYPYSWGNGTTARVVLDGVEVFDGSFNWDWRPSGLQSKLIASGTRRITHNADGNKTLNIIGYMGATGTSGAGGPTNTGTLSVAAPRRQVVPGVPTGVTATRVSDTQTKLTWAQSSPSNGLPDTNTIQEMVNGGAWTTLVTIADATSATVATSPNEKTQYRVRGNNDKGSSAYSAASAPIFTTPAAPSGVTAAKNTALDIVVTFAENVAYSEYEHEVWHGTVTGGVTTWDGSALATLASGDLSYTHTSPNAAQVHIYRVRAKASGLNSAFVSSNSVQLLVAPNKPTRPSNATYADKAQSFVMTWTHNPVDTTAQKYYEFSWSTDGGSTWSTSGKITSTTQSYTIPANRHTGGQVVTTRVRTWGQATTGGSDGTGASPWSDLRTVTFKTVPVASITAPAAGSVLTDATLRVNLGYTQAEADAFVSAEIELLNSTGTVIETKTTTTQLGTAMSTKLANGGSYSVRARVKSSSGLWSTKVTNAFTVSYLVPVAAVVTSVDYLQDTGFGQINLTIPDPGAGESAATKVTIVRTINGVDEYVIRDYPIDGPDLSVLDTVPTTHGTNTYTITTYSALGAQTVVTDVVLTTNELRRAFLNKGVGLSKVAVFGANLSVQEALSVASQVVSAAGRTKPIGLYGIETTVVLSISSFIFEGFGSTIDEMRDVLMTPGRSCYRGPDGRRVFGSSSGGIDYTKNSSEKTRGNLNLTITETS